MGIMKLGRMTLGSLFKKAPTRKYPYEKREPFARTRGQVDLIDVHDCIFCGMCQRQCPADAIVVDKKASKWTYSPYKCIACDSCVRCCPKKDIKMVAERPAITTTVGEVRVYALTAAEIAEKERIAAEKKAKILAARKAKQQKEAAARDEQATAG